MFATFARQSASEPYSNERLVNYFLRQADGVSGAVLIGRGGLTSLVTLGDRPRDMVEMQGSLYGLDGNNVWRYNVAADSLSKVGVVSATTRVSMAASGSEVAIVTGGRYYICDGATTVEYTTGAISNPQRVVEIDGYFVVSGTSGGRGDALAASNLDDGTTFNAFSFAFAENAADEIRGLAILNNRIWAFGARSVEKFVNTGASFPFEVSRSEYINQGIFAGECWAEIDNTLCWVGADRIVYRSGGGTPQVISTPEIKQVLDGSEIETCYAFLDRGHEFFAIRTTGGPTLCYDVITGLWSERTTGVDGAPWIVSSVVKYNGVQYFGTTTGKLCQISRQAYTDDGAIIEAEAVSRPLTEGGEKFTVNLVRLRAETGGVFDGTPEIMLQVGVNGYEWGVERWKSLGAVGEYNKRIQWNALGQHTHAQIRLRVTDAVQRDLYGVNFRIT